MKSKILRILLLLIVSSTIHGQKLPNYNRFMLKQKTTDNVKSLVDDLDDNLVSIKTFKKTFKKDFASVVGTNNLPTNQVTISLNKPEIEIGQLFALYKDRSKSIPVFGLYPFISGKLNDTDEFRIKTAQPSDASIGYGGKLVFIPFGLAKKTGYFFDSNDDETYFFKRKNDILKKSMSVKYSADGMKKSKKKIEVENLKYNHILDSLKSLSGTSKEQDIFDLQNKILENEIELNKVLLYEEDNKKLQSFIDESIYEAEKNAPWTKRHFLWFTLDYTYNPLSVNIFRNNIVEEDKKFRNNAWGVSANYSFFKEKSMVNAFVKFEKSVKNKFLIDYKLIKFVEDSVVTGTKYKTSTSYEVYDISKLKDNEVGEKATTNIVTFGVTYLRGADKKYGITANYRQDLDKGIANLKLGIIIPVILDNAKAEQSNLILELALPDLYSNSPDSIGKNESSFRRSYVNIKIGIPINLL